MIADVLDNFCWAALTGPQRGFGEFLGRAAQFQRDVLPLAAMDDTSDPAAWHDLAALSGRRQAVVMAREVVAPDDWARVRELSIRQMVEDGLEIAPDPEAKILGPDDVPAMMHLLTVAPPGGRFLKRSSELGTFLGLWDKGQLIAMAGERIRVDGWTEISALATDPQYRGLACTALKPEDFCWPAGPRLPLANVTVGAIYSRLTPCSEP
jgi:hypothetical protein